MGRTYVCTLSDVSEKGLVLEIRCPCGRVTWLAGVELVGRMVHGRKVCGWHRWDDVGKHLRCKGCNARGPDVAAKFPHEIGVPKGVPVLPYLLADDRERKRMVRSARG